VVVAQNAIYKVKLADFAGDALQFRLLFLEVAKHTAGWKSQSAG
jgi:hypothetical protein